MRSLGPGWCLLGAAVALTPLVSFGQTGPPKTSWGDPDLRGVWDFRTITPMERPDGSAAHDIGRRRCELGFGKGEPLMLTVTSELKNGPHRRTNDAPASQDDCSPWAQKDLGAAPNKQPMAWVQAILDELDARKT